MGPSDAHIRLVGLRVELGRGDKKRRGAFIIETDLKLSYEVKATRHTKTYPAVEVNVEFE